MKKPRIIADEKIPFLKGVLEPYADVSYYPGNQINHDLAMQADALLIRTRTICNAALLKGSPVKFIASATIGFDHIDTGYCDSNNIYWTNAPGCNSASVQQYILAALLILAQKHDYKLNNQTLGIIGVGNVGSKIEKAAKLLGLNVLLNDPPRARKEGNAGFTEFNEVLKNSDILTLHPPLNYEGEDKTYHLFTPEIFSKMKNGAWFINSSRGEVVKTEALKAALSIHKLGGAILDVWENEPVIDRELMQAVNISTPHIAGYSIDGKANGTAQVVNSLAGYFDFPLENFYPGSIPEPASPAFTIEGKGKPCLQVVHEAVNHAYAIMKDHTRLQCSPDSFEQQRGTYPPRREFPAYTISLRNSKEEAIEILKELGYRVKLIS